jgi:hypothetical protein
MKENKDLTDNMEKIIVSAGSVNSTVHELEFELETANSNLAKI